jgi:iron complex outermembrane receptor protein
MAAASVLALTASLAAASSVAAADAGSSRKPTVEEGDVEAVLVIAPKTAAADVAPIKSSLKATSPVAIIDRAFIEQNTPVVGDYTTTSSLAPSMVSAGNANGPGATDGAKLSLRGVADGQFNITYDGVTWGDTNGPSHHANSFFPNSTIGGVIIDRSPGKATDIGQASFGGSVNLFSLPVEDRMGLRQKTTFGSWGTWQSVTTLTSGPIAQLHGLNAIVNFQEYHTDGYLTNSPSNGGNQYVKLVLPLTSKINVTALYTRNDDNYYQSDISNGTVAEIEKTGLKNFALCNDPLYACYKGYNYTKKETDFEYIKEAGEIAPGLTFDNTTYSYWYSNKTLSANTQDYSKAGDATGGNQIALAPPAVYPLAGAAAPATSPGLAGYWKRNEYRVSGDTLTLKKDFEFGTLTVGGLYEVAKTKRFIYDIALPVPGTGVSLFQTPIYNIEKVAKTPVVGSTGGCAGYPVIVAAGKTNNGACQMPLNVRYNEYSGWHYYQTFAQFDYKMADNWTITPGVKYMNFKLYVHAPVESAVVQPVFLEKTYQKTLGFLSTNYRASPELAFYGQIAQGFLVPAINSFYVVNQNFSSIKPQESVAYQAGAVYAKGPLTFDADIYTIVFSHKLQSNTDPVSGQTYYTNSGGADYKGFEGQATYLWNRNFSTFGNFSVNGTEAKRDAINPGGNGKTLANAPRWTYAGGVRYNFKNLLQGNDELTLTVDSKTVGPQLATAAKGAAGPTGLIKTWSTANASLTYRFDRYAFQVQVLNLMDKQYLTGIKGSALVPGTNRFGLSTGSCGISGSAAATACGGNAPQYATPRSFQATLKVAF